MRNGPTSTVSRGRHGAKSILRLETVLLELRPHEGQRQRGAVDRTVHIRQHIGHRPDVVFVPVREHERGDTVLLQVREVRNDEVHAQELALRERHAGIDDHTGVAAGEHQEIHPELPEPSQRDDFNRRTGRDWRVSETHERTRHRAATAAADARRGGRWARGVRSPAALAAAPTSRRHAGNPARPSHTPSRDATAAPRGARTRTTGSGVNLSGSRRHRPRPGRHDRVVPIQAAGRA